MPRIPSIDDTSSEGEKTFSILYSYPTWDPHWRGQRGEKIRANSQQEAIEKIRRGEGHYGPCPDAQIVRCKEIDDSRVTPSNPL